MNIDKLQDLAGRSGMYTDLIRMGAASLVYSPGCAGVSLNELQRFVELIEAASQSRIASLTAERDEARARVAAILNAGALMANAMFNLAQRDGISERERAIFKVMENGWDIAAASPAKPPADTARTAQDHPASAKGEL